MCLVLYLRTVNEVSKDVCSVRFNIFKFGPSFTVLYWENLTIFYSTLVVYFATFLYLDKAFLCC